MRVVLFIPSLPALAPINLDGLGTTPAAFLELRVVYNNQKTVTTVTVLTRHHPGPLYTLNSSVFSKTR